MRSLVVGIAGGSGAGKTTLARSIARLATTPVSYLAFDSYYHDQRHKPHAARLLVNYDHPDALDVARFRSDLEALRRGLPVSAPVYDFSAHTRTDAVEVVEPHPIVVVDGVLLLVFDEVVELLDLAVFVDADDDLRTQRRLGRDVDERGRDRAQALSQLEQTVRPMYVRHVAPSRERAGLIVDGSASPERSAATVLAELGAPAGG